MRLLLRRTALLDTHLYELANAGRIKRLEGVARQNLFAEVIGQKRVDVVAAVAERHLREVVGAEAEEVGMPCQPRRR